MAVDQHKLRESIELYRPGIIDEYEQLTEEINAYEKAIDDLVAKRQFVSLQSPGDRHVAEVRLPYSIESVSAFQANQAAYEALRSRYSAKGIDLTIEPDSNVAVLNVQQRPLS